MAGEGTDHPGFLPGEPHGQRLVGYTVPGVAELDTTERLNTHSPGGNLKARCHHRVLLCQADKLRGPGVTV